MCAATAWWFIVFDKGLFSIAFRAAKLAVAAWFPIEAK
jgi:hypothetical protein